LFGKVYLSNFFCDAIVGNTARKNQDFRKKRKETFY